MCGISGFVDFNYNSSVANIQAMTDALIVRGPDSSGVYFDESPYAQVGLGHRRLSILDLSELGHQPMIFEHLHITFNGEVYNFEEIKLELVAIGYRFISHSDTEVILKAFHAWSVSCVEKFRGMFAFVIYDTAQHKLFMFRDRAGVKPFYYYVKDGLFLFASELKAFHKHSGFLKKINQTVIPTYMQFGYIPAPYSIFQDTYKLKAGHYISYDLASNTFDIQAYWDINSFYHADKNLSSEVEILQDLETLLTDAFQLRMVADVPVGVFLSGGIDSSVVTALLQKGSGTPLKTFTIGFDEPGYNEAEQAKEIAQHLKTEHTEYYCSKADALAVIPDLPIIYDEPFGDSSAIATILVSKLAKEQVAVVLSGDGGDEIFCGYSKYFALHKAMHLLKPGLKKWLILKAVNILSENGVNWLNNRLPARFRQTNIRDKLQKFKRALNANSCADMFIQASSYIDPSRIKGYLHDEFESLPKTGFTRFSELQNNAPLEQMMAVDYQTFMVDDVLTKVDRATMSVSIEGREPLLDHKISEYMARVPISMKYQQATGKYLLRKVLYKYVPEHFYTKPKSGFQVPLFEWLKTDLKYLLDKYLAYDRLAAGGIFNADLVQQTLKAYFKGEYININELWFILMFEMWREQWDV